MKKLARIKPFLFENNLFMSLDSGWIDVFGAIPEFDVVIDNQNKLRFTSTEKVQMKGTNKN